MYARWDASWNLLQCNGCKKYRARDFRQAQEKRRKKSQIYWTVNNLFNNSRDAFMSTCRESWTIESNVVIPIHLICRQPKQPINNSESRGIRKTTLNQEEKSYFCLKQFVKDVSVLYIRRRKRRRRRFYKIAKRIFADEKLRIFPELEDKRKSCSLHFHQSGAQ